MAEKNKKETFKKMLVAIFSMGLACMMISLLTVLIPLFSFAANLGIIILIITIISFGILNLFLVIAIKTSKKVSFKVFNVNRIRKQFIVLLILLDVILLITIIGDVIWIIVAKQSISGTLVSFGKVLIDVGAIAGIVVTCTISTISVMNRTKLKATYQAANADVE